MGGQRSVIVILVASAYVGGAAALATCWHEGVILAILAAPIGASLAVLCTAFLLYQYRSAVRARPAAAVKPAPSEGIGRAAWPRRPDLGAGRSL